MQGCASERQFNDVERRLSTLTRITLGGPDAAIEAARNFRRLRAQGVTVRKTIDTVIATRCLLDGFELLHGALRGLTVTRASRAPASRPYPDAAAC